MQKHHVRMWVESGLGSTHAQCITAWMVIAVLLKNYGFSVICMYGQGINYTVDQGARHIL